MALAARGVREAARGDAWVGLLWPGESDERGVLLAALRLAAVAVARGRHGDARRFIRFAESLDEPPAVVAQPEGIGSWYVPAAASRLLSAVDPEAAARFQAEAVRRGYAPPSPSPAVVAGFVPSN